MPGFDGTGPAGMGPMTGGGRGWCNPYAGYRPYPAPYSVPASPIYTHGFARPPWGQGRRFLGRGRGLGWGRGRGLGRGRGWWW